MRYRETFHSPLAREYLSVPHTDSCTKSYICMYVWCVQKVCNLVTMNLSDLPQTVATDFFGKNVVVAKPR